VLYKHVLGDKDTFSFAFAMARKLHEVYAVAVPPAAAFKQEVRAHMFCQRGSPLSRRSSLFCVVLTNRKRWVLHAHPP
jgi:hypothetical protein